MAGRLEGKRVLITGTGGGQGEAAQRIFAREGAHVAGCDVTPGAAARTAAELASEGLRVIGRDADLGDPTEAQDWVDWAAAELGGIDVLYNNASSARFAPFAQLTVDMWRSTLRNELDLVFLTTQAAWRHLTDGGGSIVNVSSVSGVRGGNAPGQAAHAAAKGGVLGLTRQIAAEGAPLGIRANTVVPSFIDSPATSNLPAAERDFIIDKHLIKRAGTPDDVALMALYLASDESSWITGGVFPVDGGLLARA